MAFCHRSTNDAFSLDKISNGFGLALQLANAREQLPERVSVEELPQDDAWLRDTGPTVRNLSIIVFSQAFQAVKTLVNAQCW